MKLYPDIFLWYASVTSTTDHDANSPYYPRLWNFRIIATRNDHPIKNYMNCLTRLQLNQTHSLTVNRIIKSSVVIPFAYILYATAPKYS